MTYKRLIHLGQLALALSLLLTGATARALEAGVAKVRMTIPAGTPLAGDADRQGVAALGEHDPLWARVLFLNDGENQIYLVTVDLHHIPRALRGRVLDLSESMVSGDQIVLTATHTGNGPGGLESDVARRWANGRFQPELLESVAMVIVDGMRGARESAQRATLGYGTARQQVLSVNANDPEGPIDEQIGVVRVDNADGQALAILTSFSAMPRLVPTSHRYYFSADYPGAYYTQLEELSDPGCVAMFLPGALGGQNSINPEGTTGWAAIESVGRLLAVRTKEVANRMSFRDTKVSSFYAEVTLPETVAGAFVPETTILQAVKLDELLLLFLPAIPSVEVGRALSRHANQLGFDTTFVVAASNDDVMNVVSRNEFFQGTPEAQRHHYGPDMTAWLEANLAALIQGEQATNPPPDRQDNPRGSETAITLNGSGYERGLQQGRAFGAALDARYEKAVRAAIRANEMLPQDPLWSHWPPFLDATPIALPALASGIRPWLQNAQGDTLAALEGMADGASMPFDAVWLTQNAHVLRRHGEESKWFQAPLGTMVAVLGDRAGADGTIIGFNLDWPTEEEPVVSTVKPEKGLGYVEVGFGWHLGTHVGVNEAGVTVALLELGIPDETTGAGLPVSLVLGEILREARDFDGAVALLRERSGARSGRVLISGATAEGWKTAVIALGSGLTVRTESDGMLLGVDASREGANDATRERYHFVTDLLGGERIVDTDEMARSLVTGDPEDSERYHVWNRDTRFSVVIVPGRQSIQASLAGEGHLAGAFETYMVKRGSTHE